MRYKDHNAACHAALKNHKTIKDVKTALKSGWYKAFDDRNDIQMIQDRLALAAWDRSKKPVWG